MITSAQIKDILNAKIGLTHLCGITGLDDAARDIIKLIEGSGTGAPTAWPPIETEPSVEVDETAPVISIVWRDASRSFDIALSAGKLIGIISTVEPPRSKVAWTVDMPPGMVTISPEAFTRSAAIAAEPEPDWKQDQAETSRLPRNREASPEPDACARCGEPRKEHSYNGACYGKCGEFVSPEPDAMRAALIKAKTCLLDGCLPWVRHNGPREGTTHGRIDETVAAIDAALSRPAHGGWPTREQIATELIAHGEFSSIPGRNYYNALMAADAIMSLARNARGGEAQ